MILITRNSNNEINEENCSTERLVAKWYCNNDVPNNNDEVVYCSIGSLRLYFKTFGRLMEALTGDFVR